MCENFCVQSDRIKFVPKKIVNCSLTRSHFQEQNTVFFLIKTFHSFFSSPFAPAFTKRVPLAACKSFLFCFLQLKNIEQAPTLEMRLVDSLLITLIAAAVVARDPREPAESSLPISLSNLTNPETNGFLAKALANDTKHLFIESASGVKDEFESLAGILLAPVIAHFGPQPNYSQPYNETIARQMANLSAAAYGADPLKCLQPLFGNCEVRREERGKRVFCLTTAAALEAYKQSRIKIASYARMFRLSRATRCFAIKRATRRALRTSLCYTTSKPSFSHFGGFFTFRFI